MKGLRPIVFFLLLIFLVGCPGKSAFPHPDGTYAYEQAQRLSRIVPRHAGSEGAERAAELLKKTILDSFPRFRVETDTFRDRTPEGEMTFRNVWAVLPGRSREFLVIGAHYDAKKLEGVPEFQGANDGGSGVGVLLAMMK